MDPYTGNLNKIFIGGKSKKQLQEPNRRLSSYFAHVTPAFRNIEDFLTGKILEYPAVVGSVYNIGSEEITRALSGCEKAFLITQNANFRDRYLNRKKWEEHYGWQCYPFRSLVDSIFENTSDEWFVSLKQLLVAELSYSLEPVINYAESEEFQNLVDEKVNSILGERSFNSNIQENGPIEKLRKNLSLLFHLSVLDPFFGPNKEEPFYTVEDLMEGDSFFKPFRMPGNKTLLYSGKMFRDRRNVGVSSLLHHKFVVFLQKSESLFRPKENPGQCSNCSLPLEAPNRDFWDDLVQEWVEAGESLEDARELAQEQPIECPRCDEQNTFYHPDWKDEYHDCFPECNPRYEPVAVWTGSFNFTYSAANKHLENGVFIDSPAVAELYFKEWAMNWMVAQKVVL